MRNNCEKLSPSEEYLRKKFPLGVGFMGYTRVPLRLRRQVLRKYALLEECRHDESLLQAWATAKLARQAAYEQVRAVGSAIQEITGLAPSEFRCPSWCNLRAVRPGEVRLQQADGTAIFMTATDPPEFIGVVLPLAGLAYPFPSVTHVVDRCSIGSSGLFHKQSQNYLEIAFWDIFHGQWRSIKATAQKVKWMWRSIAAVTPVVNMNNGPFHSLSWGATKKAFVQRWIDENTIENPRFIAEKPELAAEAGLPCGTVADDQVLFGTLAEVPSFCEAGPYLKLSRFNSIEDCWKYHRPEIRRHRFLLREMADYHRGVQAGDVQQQKVEAEEDDDRSAEEIVAKMKEEDGTLLSAAVWLSDNNIDHMDIFSVVTAACRNYWTVRATLVQTPEEGLMHFALLAEGACQIEVQQTITQSLYSPLAAQRLHFASRPDLVKKTFEYAVSLAGSRTLAMCNHSYSFPECTAAVFSAQTVEAKAVLLREYDEHFTRLLNSEALALARSDFKEVLQKIPWTGNALVRLFLEQSRLAKCSPTAEGTTRTLRNIHERFPDSKGAEDVHQELRDAKRVSRHPRVSREKRQFVQNNSHVFRKRKISHATAVTTEEICRASPAIKRKRMVESFTANGGYPKDMSTIMLPRRTWLSVTPQNGYNGISGWMWITHWWAAQLGPDISVGAAWLSRFAVPLSLLQTASGEHMLVLAALDWGVLGYKVVHMHGSAFRMDTSSRPISWSFVTSATAWRVAAFEVRYDEAHGVLLDVTQDWQTFVVAAMSAGVRVNKSDHKRLLEALGVHGTESAAILARMKEEDTFDAILELVFHDYDDTTKAEKIKEYYAHGAPDAQDDGTDGLEQLLETIRKHDPGNIEELRDLTHAVKRKLAVKLAGLRAQARLSASKKKDQGQGSWPRHWRQTPGPWCEVNASA